MVKEKDQRFQKLQNDKRFRTIVKKNQAEIPTRYSKLVDGIRCQYNPRGGKALHSQDQIYLKGNLNLQEQPEDLRHWMQGYEQESSERQAEAELGENFVEDQEQIPEVTQSSSRLALQNYDWSNIQEDDIFNLATSFKGQMGRVIWVKVFRSQFGKERMEYEDQHGPKWEYPGLSPDDALRAYQKDRLKYYYAIIACDSNSTAQAIYNNCNGLQFEKSNVIIDLRFVPDSLQLPDDPVACTTFAKEGKSKDFVARAVGHSNVHLTWDQQDQGRKKALSKNWSRIGEAELKAIDWRDYIDISDDSDCLEQFEEIDRKDSRKKSWGGKEQVVVKFKTGLGKTEPIPKASQRGVASRARRTASRQELKLLVREEKPSRQQQADLEDPRFRKIFTDSKFAIDPSDSAFKPKTSGRSLQMQVRSKHKS